MPLDTIITTFLQRGVPNYLADLNRLRGAVENFEDRTKRLNFLSNSLVGTGAAAASAMTLVMGAVLRETGTMQKVDVGLTTMLGSKAAAVKKFKEIQDFALKAPFDFKDSSIGVMRLLAVGYAAEKTLPTLRAVGNAVSAGGGGNQEFTRVITALSHIQTKGRATWRELYSISYANIPVAKILREELGLTAEQIRRVGHMGIEASVIIPALLRGMNKIGGGKAMDEMIKTIPGRLSNLRDALEQSAMAIGGAVSKDIDKALIAVTELAVKLKGLAESNPELIRTYLRIAAIGSVSLMAVGMVGKLAGILSAIRIATAGGGGVLRLATGGLGMARLAGGATAGAALASGTAGAASTATGAAAAIAGGGGILAGLRSWLGSPLRAMRTAGAPTPVTLSDPANLRAALGLNTSRPQVMDFPTFRRFAGGGGRWVDSNGRFVSERNLLRAPRRMVTPSDIALDEYVSGVRHVNARRAAAAAERAERGNFWSNTSRGKMLGAGLLGVGAGAGLYSDMRSLGYAKDQAAWSAAILGVGASAAAMFIPGAAPYIALAEGFRFAFDKVTDAYYDTKGMERGSGLSDAEAKAQAGKSQTDQAGDYFELAQRKRAEAAKLRGKWNHWFYNDRIKGLEDDAKAAELMGKSRRKSGARQDAEAAAKAAQARMEQEMMEKDRLAQLRKDRKFQRTNALTSPGYVNSEMMKSYAGRDGSRMVTFQHTVRVDAPDSAEDLNQRYYQGLAPQPDLG